MTTYTCARIHRRYPTVHYVIYSQQIRVNKFSKREKLAEIFHLHTKFPVTIDDNIIRYENSGKYLAMNLDIRQAALEGACKKRRTGL